jgi:hypothetical protein
MYMARRRHAVRLGIPALIVGGLAVLAIWRLGPPPDPGQPIGTTGLIDREASVEGIEIRQLTSATTFWAGDIDEKPLFAVVSGNTKRAAGVKILPGREVTLIGTVRAAPPVEEMMARWRLDAATAASVHELGTYLDVKEVR